MIFVAMDEVYCSFSYLGHYLFGQQLFDGLHERCLAIISLGGVFEGSIVESLSNRVRGDHLFHVVPKLAKEFMIEADGPVLAQELNNIRNKPIIISLADLIQVLIRKANEAHQGRYLNLITTQITHIIYDAIGVNRKLNIMSFEIFNIFA